jgi:hypothetical protein
MYNEKVNDKVVDNGVITVLVFSRGLKLATQRTGSCGFTAICLARAWAEKSKRRNYMRPQIDGVNYLATSSL